MIRTFALVLLVGAAMVVSTATKPKPAWRMGALAKPTDKINLLIAVRQQNLDQLTEAVQAVSDPQSSEYGQYWKRSEIAELIGDSKRATQIAEWLSSSCGASKSNVHVSGGSDFIRATLTVAQLNRAGCVPDHPMRVYHHPTKRSVAILRSQHAHIAAHKNGGAFPLQLRDSIDVVTGLTDFPPVFNNKRAADAYTRTTTRGGPNAPQWVNLVASDTQVYFQFQPMCKDGSAAGTDFCGNAQQQPAINQFTIRVIVNGSSSDTAVGCGSYLWKNETRLGAGDGIVCADQAPVPAFAMLTFRLQTNYADGSSSDWADDDTPTLSSPFVSTQLNDLFYGITRGNGPDLSQGSQSCVQFGGNYCDPQMSNDFYQYMNIPYQPFNIIGPNDPTNPEGEANQDIQWIIGVGQGVNTTFWSTYNATVGQNAFILEWQYQVDAANDVPLVYSISYGQSEADTVQQYGAGYAQRCEIEFQKMALRGLTVVIADGDSGVSGGDNCGPSFNPDWPGSSAYVTSASASGISSYHADCVAVSVKTGFAYTTGGGFSTFFSQPTYQTSMVNQYLTNAKQQNKLPPNSYFNIKGRAYPDVSTLGSGLLTFYDGQGWLNPFPGGGTSFSAPIMAGMLAMLNSVRISNGKPPLGFANPWLYQIAASNPEAFYDITIGENSCNGGDVSQCCQYGFECITGFDVPSGLGSPNFNVLVTLV